MIGTPPFVAEVEAKAEEQAEVEADKDGHRHEPFEPLQWPGVLPRPPSAAEALSDFVMRGAHPDEEASSDPAWPDGAWLARTRLQRALLSEGGGWLVAYMIAAGGVSWRALAQQMVARPEWRPGLCASACIPWGSDLARALMLACGVNHRRKSYAISGNQSQSEPIRANPHQSAEPPRPPGEGKARNKLGMVPPMNTRMMMTPAPALQAVFDH